MKMQQVPRKYDKTVLQELLMLQPMPSIEEKRRENGYPKIFSRTGRSARYFFVDSSETIEPFFTRKIPFWKRAMDVCGALAGLILFSPIFLMTALVIKVVSSGPVFFRQERLGYGGRKFTFLKFRTMKVNADPSKHRQYLAALIEGENGDDEPMIKLDDRNPHIIPLGNILRQTCLDELPQLINVLRGEMSLVGPRPPIPYEVEKYSGWHNDRFDTLPGMTGLWQVSGKNRLTFKEMIRLDIQYSRDMSFLTDVKILLRTPFAIMSEFSGNRH
jgi:lipopolysaccharide/colanic/teichoic acid biosynthesis glycosyltransferase